MPRARTGEQLRLPFADPAPAGPDTTSTFADNLALPVHRWFRYPAGFSALWVRDLLDEKKREGKQRVLDPFCGSGTVLLEAESAGVCGAGVEAHPFVTRVAKAKLRWREDHKRFREYALAVLDKARGQESEASSSPALIRKCYPPETLARLESLRSAWQDVADGSALSELIWLALASILRQCSPVGTAQWQYVLPGKSKAKAEDPYQAFAAKIHLMSNDMLTRQQDRAGSPAKLYSDDARLCAAIPDAWADLVITSPPYANNYDYADATRLEMSFFGEIQGWGDLQEAVRKFLVRSCTQHVSRLVGETDRFLEDPILAPVAAELKVVCARLDRERMNHGGKKPYHTMIALYFCDLARVWMSLRRIAVEGAEVYFVIGDSAPYGVYVPVDRWLGELALAAGFKSYTFEKTRDRNTKWENRKHRVPLHEGRLCVIG